MKSVKLLEAILAAARVGAMSPVDVLESLPQFQPASSWASWRAFLCACFGLPMPEAELAIYRRCTGRVEPPAKQVREAWVPVGRRGGKDRIASLIVAYLASYRDYSQVLAPGQRGTLPVIAADRKQARELMSYLHGIFVDSPLSVLLDGDPTGESIHLKTRVTIEVHTASYRSVRGYTLVGAVLNEVAFWRSEDGSKNPDREILSAIRPGLATVPGSILVALSSPYAQRGVLWDAYEKHYGREGDDILVWQADTLSMHPGNEHLVAEIERAYKDDPQAARAEYGAQFRSDVLAYVSAEVVNAAVVPDRHELLYDRHAPRAYFAFVDPSGGSQDSMTLAIAHHEGAKIVLDCLREWEAPFQPEQVTAEAAVVLQSYKVRQVYGDRYGGEWPRDRFRAHGIQYVESEKTKSDIYQDMLPLLNSGNVELLDHPRLKAQLIALDRKTSRAGRDSIDTPPGIHDDVANCAAGAIVLADVLGSRRKHPQAEPDPPTTTREILVQKRAEAFRRETEGPKPTPNRYRRGRR